MTWFKRGENASSGQSLIELIIGIAIAAIIAGSVVGAIMLSVRINKQSIATKVASSLGQETLDDLRSISEGRWQRIYDLDTKDASSTYYIFNEDTVIAQDTISSAGRFSSLVLDSADYPVIAYYSATDNLKVLHCNDDDCAGDDESIETVDSGGFFNSIQLNGVNPVIAHYNDTTDDFKIVHCNDEDCSGGSESSELIDNRISGLSLQLDGFNYPVVSYQKTVGKNLYLLHCNDPDCSGGDENIKKADGRAQTGDYTSLALSSAGIPVIAYSNGNKLGVVRCNDVNCAGGDEIDNQVDTTVNSAEFISIQLDSRPDFLDYPVVSYYDASPRYDLKILRCNDVSCLGDDESIVTVDTLGGESTSLQLDSLGNPVVSYIANDKLKILHCNDIYCLGGDESIVAVDDADPDANISGTSLRLDSLGNPVVSYYDDVNYDLKVLHCDDPNCDENVFTALDIASGTEDIIIGGTAYTRWFSIENVNRDDVTGDIVEGGGAGTTEDSSTQKITTYVQWDVSGDIANVSLVEYFTRSTRNTATVFTDWDGISGAEGIITDPTSNFSTSTEGIDFSIPGEIFLTTASTSTVSWYDSDWGKRMKISVDSSKVPSILADFPMLISSIEAFWAGDQADGGGFLFTSSNGTTKLDHEIERYDSPTGELIAWVEIPTLASSTGTDIYIYYDNTTGGLDEQNITGTWSNGFVGVWHLEETCSDGDTGCIKDSTGNNDATAKQFEDGGGGTTNATGKLGGADLFSGEPCAGGGCDYHQIPADSSLDVQDNYTVSLWAFQQGAADPVGRYFSSIYNTGLAFWMDNSGTVGTAYHVNNADWPNYRIHESNGQNLDIWEHLAFTVNGTIGKIYRDASEQTLSIDNITGTPNDSGINGAYIGVYLPSHVHRFEGKLDEVRLSNVTRSQDWITTGFNSQNSPSTFYTVGEEIDSP